jgi:Uma2 family endonuclease
MAITKPPSASALLTYAQYMAEETIHRRYDILDGARIYMPGPTWRHQRIQFHITRILHAYEEASQIGLVLPAPFDVLIQRDPLRTRQPDVLFVTHTQLARGGGIPAKGPIEVAPELVVEILSDSETERLVEEKIADYIAIGVREVWLVRPEPRTVEVLPLTSNGPVSVATYTETQPLPSVTFSDLKIVVADCFQP